MRNLMTAVFFLFLFLPFRVMANPMQSGPLGPTMQTLLSALY